MIEYDQPGYLNTPIGDLLINQEITGLGTFLAVAQKCNVRRGLRAVKDTIPQGDGAILHRRFSDGIELTIVLELWKTVDTDGAVGEPACGEDLRLMLEHLGLYLQAILNGRGRWFWTPSGYGDDRMLDDCRWLVDVSREVDGPRTTVTFGIDSPWPYFIDASEQFGSDTLIPDGSSAILTNNGNHETYPVIEVLGGLAGVTDFTITNASLVDQNGDQLQIVYTGDPAIVAGEYAEIDVFRQTIYANGSGANLKAGIDPVETDFFVLRPGDNAIFADGADVNFKYNNAFVPV